MNMKKIGIVVALALIVTIGGVYATWNYTVSNGVVDSQTTTATISLTSKEVIELENGTITVTPNALSIVVDDVGDGTHTAKLTITGSITVSFDGEDAGGNPLGLTLKCTAADDCGKYKEADVFKYTQLTSGSEVTKDNTWTISADDLAELIQLNGTITAPTSTDYDALQTAINDKTITLTFAALE